MFDLLMVLTCSPEVPEKYVTPSQRTSQQLGKSEAKKPATDEEVMTGVYSTVIKNSGRSSM